VLAQEEATALRSNGGVPAHYPGMSNARARVISRRIRVDLTTMSAPWCPAVWLLALVGVGAAVAIDPIIALVVGLLSAILILIVVPLRWMGAIALVAWALFPVKYFPFPGDPAVISGASLVVAVWLARYLSAAKAEPREHLLNWPLLALAAWLVLLTLRVGVISLSGQWTFNFLLLAVVPALLLSSDPSYRGPLLTTIISLGAALGSVAAIETYVLHANPIYDWAYKSATPSLIQLSSVYRATTTLGHPLVNAAFFVVAAPLSLDAYLRGQGRKYLFALAAASVGVLTTASRSGAIALALGLGVTAIASARWGGRIEAKTKAISAGSIALAAIVVLFIAVSLSGSLYDRHSSLEGRASAEYRESSIGSGLILSREAPLFGVGPGRADSVKRLNVRAGNSRLGLENSWLQVLVALGWPGLCLFTATMLRAARSSVRCRDAGLVGALTAYSMIAGGFNLIEGQWPALLLLGILLGSASKPSASRTTESASATLASPSTSRTRSEIPVA
jgi:hypothetical protein